MKSNKERDFMQTGKPVVKCDKCVTLGERLFQIQNVIDDQSNNPLLWPNPTLVTRDDGAVIEVPLSDSEAALKDALGALHKMVEEITCQ